MEDELRVWNRMLELKLHSGSPVCIYEDNDGDIRFWVKDPEEYTDGLVFRKGLADVLQEWLVGFIERRESKCPHCGKARSE